MTYYGKLRPLEDDRRRRQRLSFLKNHGGKDGYRKMGKKGGANSPSKFTSETARAAAFKSHAKRREQREAAERAKNEDGLSSNQKNKRS